MPRLPTIIPPWGPPLLPAFSKDQVTATFFKQVILSGRALEPFFVLLLTNVKEIAIFMSGSSSSILGQILTFFVFSAIPHHPFFTYPVYVGSKIGRGLAGIVICSLHWLLVTSQVGSPMYVALSNIYSKKEEFSFGWGTWFVRYPTRLISQSPGKA